MKEMKDDDGNNIKVLARNLRRTGFAELTMSNLKSGTDVPKTADNIRYELQKIFRNELPRSKLTRYHPVSREQSELLSKILSL